MSILGKIVDTIRPAAKPVRPAVIRVGVGAYSAVHNLSRRKMFRDLHRQDESRFKPVGMVKVLKKPLPPKVADAIFDVAQVVNVATTAGIAHKVTGPLNAALQLWVYSYRNSWGMIFHSDNGMIMHQAVLGLSPSADALSVDSLIRERTLSPDRFSRVYGGIPFAMNIAPTAVYFLSGVAKVRSPMGWKWAGGRALREQVAADAIRKEVFGAKAPETAEHVWKAGDKVGVLAAGALAIELGAPIALLHPKLGRAFSLAALSMHWGIYLVMGIKFRYYMTGVGYLPYWPVGPVRGPAD